MTELLTFQPGDTVQFHHEPGVWTVRGVTTAGRFAVLTQPRAARRPGDSTVLYTIVDRERWVRGQDNYHGLGYETAADVAEVLHALQHTEDGTHPDKGCTLANGVTIGDLCIGQAEVSWRSANHVALDVFIINHTDRHDDADHA